MRPAARPPRPDPNPMRLLLAMGGIASASALLTAMLPSVAPVTEADAGAGATSVAVAVPEPSVIHVKQYVTLKPGQTAPPQAPVVVRPTPTPRVKVVTHTRQSGTP